MGPTIIARNYAETLLDLARMQGGDRAIDDFATAIEEASELLRRDPRIQQFLDAPGVDVESKKRAVRAALSDRVPAPFLRFLLVVVEKRRQSLLGPISDEYHALVDELRGRVRAELILASEPDTDMQRELQGTLERRLGKTVVPTFRVDPTLMGGIVVRIGDRIIDGSVRRKIGTLRRRLLEVRIPETAT